MNEDKILFWCLNCNLPLITSYCNSCKKFSNQTLPLHTRPAFTTDREILKKTLQKYYGEDVITRVLSKYIIFLEDKIKSIIDSIDRFENIIINGKIIGVINFDIKKNDYEFTPSEYFGDLFKESTSNPSWDDVISANCYELNRCYNEAIDFIKTTVANYNLPVYVGFSGGKDSCVLLHLCKEALNNNFKIYFIDTGIELPDTKIFLDQFLHTLNLQNNIVKVKAKNIFWESIPIFGPPAKDYNWCCKLCKIGPLSKIFTETGSLKYLVFTGVRKHEFLERETTKRIVTDMWIENEIMAHPVLEWTTLQIWMYIMWMKLNVNPIYDQGFDRVLCWLCPLMHYTQHQRVKKKYPKLYGKFLFYLYKWKEKYNLPNEWIEYGLWRWVEIPDEFKEYRNKTNWSPSLITCEPILLNIVKGYGPCRNLVPEAEGIIGVDYSKNLFNILGILKQKDESVLQLDTLNVISKIIGNRIKIKATNRNQLDKFVSDLSDVLLRSHYCRGCGICSMACPKKAITFTNNKVHIDEKKCNHCLSCSKNCPIVRYYTD